MDDIPLLREDTSTVKPGATYRRRGFLYHVRAVVDDDQVVVRAWNRRLPGWVYRVEWIYVVASYIRRSREEAAL